MVTRRHVVSSAGLAMLGATFAPRIAFAAAPTTRRFVFVIQRGAADGLGTLVPYADPAYAAARGVLADGPFQKLDGMFGLHPMLAQSAAMYRSGEALFAHAIASPYRDRSHFDGQNVLETGGAQAYAVKDGWLNRLLTVLPQGDTRAIAIAATVPMALRGRVEVASYAPSVLPDATDDLLARVTHLYAGDAQLHGLWEQAMATRNLTGDIAADDGRNAAATGALAAKLLAPPDGARIAMIETGGWDTHSGQQARLAGQLRGLDAMIAAIKTGMGPAWKETMVLVATEFGRTVAVNGTGGTDHGTASAAMLFGGGVKGGRVLADWPGLTPANLFEGRDLKPTTSLDGFIAGAAASHFGIDPARTVAALFPKAGAVKAVEGLA
ncbi:DUF1501 domain-containing protein [Roseomonas aeriglobus]|nr:DUF1501 domain-containing protein [Roseomonas aeriglobus]